MSKKKIEKFNEFNSEDLMSKLDRMELDHGGGNRGGGNGDDGDDDDDWSGIVDPEDCQFEVVEIEWNIGDPPIVSLSVSSISDPSNDDIREVRHPDFNDLWENEMENTWSTYTMTLDEARTWCLSIGMTEVIGLSGQVGG